MQDDTYCGCLLQIGLRRGGREGADGTEGWGAVGTGDVFWIRNIKHLRRKMHRMSILYITASHNADSVCVCEYNTLPGTTAREKSLLSCTSSLGVVSNFSAMLLRVSRDST